MTKTRIKPSVGLIWIFLVLGLVTAFMAIFAAMLMTEVGQLLDWPRQWLITYYEHRWLYIAINLILLAVMWVLNARYALMHRFLMGLATVGVFVCIYAANFLLPAMFPSSQTTAHYVSIEEADRFMKPDDIIYAVEINGDVRGFPRHHLEIPHIAGDTIGGEDVTMTFCALSNLPVVIDQSSDGERMDLAILIQVHNNLLMKDSNSGEVIQQITGEKEFSGGKVTEYPNDMMSWETFRTLYPEATVFEYQFNRPVDALLQNLFEGPLEQHFDEEQPPIFPTLDMKDTRLPHKEQVWGLNLNDRQIAITKEFAEQHPHFAFELDGQPLLLYYDNDLDVVTLFDRRIDGETVEVTEVDFFGNTPSGKLSKVPMQNGVFWMVWSHWFPETGILG